MALPGRASTTAMRRRVVVGAGFGLCGFAFAVGGHLHPPKTAIQPSDAASWVFQGFNCKPAVLVPSTQRIFECRAKRLKAAF